MRKNSPLILAALIVMAGPAMAAPFNPDPLTVSGRFNAPKAVDGPMKAALIVGTVTVPPANAEMMGGKVALVQPAMTAALEKSLQNFGYLAAGPNPNAITLAFEAEPFEVTTDADATSVVARIRVHAEGPSAACVPTIAEAKFRALAPFKGVGTQRTTAWVMLLGLTAVGLDGTMFTVDQLNTAAASDAARNGRRERTEFEGVSPEKSAKGMARFAAVNASQLAAADLVRQMGKAACAPQPGAGPS